MALERKDIRAKLDPEHHAVLVRIADAERVDIAELIERELVRYIEHELHRATVISGSAGHPGISGISRSRPGKV